MFEIVDSVALFRKEGAYLEIKKDGSITELEIDCSRPNALRGKVPRVDPLSAMTFCAIEQLLDQTNGREKSEEFDKNLSIRVWSNVGNMAFRREFLQKFERGYISANHYAASNPNALCSVSAIGLGLTGGHGVFTGSLDVRTFVRVMVASSGDNPMLLGFCDYDDQADDCSIVVCLVDPKSDDLPSSLAKSASALTRDDQGIAGFLESCPALSLHISA